MDLPKTQEGRLLLIPTPLVEVAQTPLTAVLPQTTINAASALHHWIVENAKTARAFLGSVHAISPLSVPLQHHVMTVLPKHSQLDPASALALLKTALNGQDVGLLSEAGAPCIADPGAAIVAAAHELGVTVVPMVGPSSILLGLMASGLEGQRFAFQGYLPVQAEARDATIRALEGESAQRHQTQLCIETPYRNAALLLAMTRVLQRTTRLTVACGLTGPQAFVRTRTVEQWRREGIAMPDKIPALFGFLAG